MQSYIINCRERRDGVPYGEFIKTQLFLMKLLQRHSNREDEETDENGDYSGRRQYQDTARPKERREKTIIKNSLSKSDGIKKRSPG